MIMQLFLIPCSHIQASRSSQQQSKQEVSSYSLYAKFGCLKYHIESGKGIMKKCLVNSLLLFCFYFPFSDQIESVW